MFFLKEIENMYSMFLSSYRNTRESLGELEKAVSCSPKLSLVFLTFFNIFQHYSTFKKNYHFALFFGLLLFNINIFLPVWIWVVV